MAYHQKQMESKFKHKQINPHLKYVTKVDNETFSIKSISRYNVLIHSLSILRWLLLFMLWLIVVILWMPKISPKTGPFSCEAILSISIRGFASIFIFYALYHLTSLVFAFVPRQVTLLTNSQVNLDIPVGLIITTCDDFQESATETLLKQDYKNFHVYICDDSRNSEIKGRIDEFHHKNQTKTTVIRRTNNTGFKAGNINHALRTGLITEPLILLIDADGWLGPQFLGRLLAEFIYSNASFLQASHQAVYPSQTSFQQMLSPSVSVHWRTYEQTRNIYGLPLMHGHGVLLPRLLLEKLGGFDETITSEDIDFSYKIALNPKYGRGHISCQTWGFEEIPPSFQHYHIRFCRWLKQDLILALRILPKLFRGCFSLSERFDVFIRQLHIPVCGLAFPYLLILMIFLAFSNISLNQIGANFTHIEKFILITVGLILSLAPIFPILLLAKEGFLKRIYCATGSIWLFNSLIIASWLALVELFTHSFEVKFIPTGSQKHNQIEKTTIRQLLLYLAMTLFAAITSCMLLMSMMLAALSTRIYSPRFKCIVNYTAAILLIIGFLQLWICPVYILAVLPLGIFRY